MIPWAFFWRFRLNNQDVDDRLESRRIQPQQFGDADLSDVDDAFHPRPLFQRHMQDHGSPRVQTALKQSLHPIWICHVGDRQRTKQVHTRLSDRYETARAVLFREVAKEVQPIFGVLERIIGRHGIAGRFGIQQWLQCFSLGESKRSDFIHQWAIVAAAFDCAKLDSLDCT